MTDQRSATVDVLQYATHSPKRTHRFHNFTLFTIALMLPIAAAVIWQKFFALTSDEYLLFLALAWVPSFILIAFMRSRIAVRIGLALLVMFLHLAGLYVILISSGPWI